MLFFYFLTANLVEEEKKNFLQLLIYLDWTGFEFFFETFTVNGGINITVKYFRTSEHATLKIIFGSVELLDKIQDGADSALGVKDSI